MGRVVGRIVPRAGTLGGPRSLTTAINRAGVAVGWTETKLFKADGKTPVVRAFRCDLNVRPLRMVDLGTLDFVSTTGAFVGTSSALAINDSGVVGANRGRHYPAFRVRCCA